MSEGNYNVDNIPTYVALPVDAFDNNSLQKPEQFRIIKNAIIKTLSDGSLCIIDTNDVFFYMYAQMHYLLCCNFSLAKTCLSSKCKSIMLKRTHSHKMSPQKNLQTCKM
jgi:hypothetical protein